MQHAGNSCDKIEQGGRVKSPSSVPGNEKKLFDRQWLVKLIRKHNENMTDKSQAPSYPILQNKALVVAPMVEQSDLPFRLLCRKYGANLAFTPMIHSRYFCIKHSYRHKMWRWEKVNINEGALKNRTKPTFTAMNAMPEDRPLIAQLCGNNKQILLQAAQQIQHSVDAIDLNCGCPTKTAKRGGYGAYLLQSGDHLINIVKHLAENIECPLTVKVRLLPGGIEESIQLYEKLVEAGTCMLTIHGRTRFQKGSDTDKADWGAIRKVVNHLGHRVPIIANGNIGSLQDVCDCLAFTGADGIMSSEAILEYPPLFSSFETMAKDNDMQRSAYRSGPGRIQLAKEYLDLCQKYPPENGGGGTGIQCIRMHLYTFLHADISSNDALQALLFKAETIDELYDIVSHINAVHQKKEHRIEHEQLSWYYRHRKAI